MDLRFGAPTVDGVSDMNDIAERFEKQGQIMFRVYPIPWCKRFDMKTSEARFRCDKYSIDCPHCKFYEVIYHVVEHSK